MRFHGKDFDIPQVCLDLGFEYHSEESARMHNAQLDLTLFVNEPNSGKKRYVLQDCNDGPVGMVNTDDELRKLVSKVRGRAYSQVASPRGFCGM